MSNIKTIKELKASSKDGRGTPYTNQVVKAHVVKLGHTASFLSSSGEDMKMLNFCVADATDCVLATLNDMGKCGMVKEGASLHLRNFLWKGGKIVLTKNSKLMMAPKLEIPPNVREQALALICPPSPLTPIKKVGQMVSGKLATVKGRIIKDECVKTVKVQTIDTPIHTIRLQEDGEEINVSLWRDLAEVELRVGDYVEVSQCIKGEYLHKAQLNSTRNTVVSKVEMPSREIAGIIEGLSCDGGRLEIAINNDGSYEDFIVDEEVFINALSMDAYDEQGIMEMMPLAVSVIVKGADVLGMTLDN